MYEKVVIYKRFLNKYVYDHYGFKQKKYKI